MSRQKYKAIDWVKVEVETDPTGLLNLAQNPSGELGTWAYVTPLANTAVVIDGIWNTLKFVTNAAQAAYWRTELIPMKPGHYVAARFDALTATASTVTTRCRFEFYDSARSLLASGGQTAVFAGDFAAKSVAPAQAPANTAYVALRWDLYRNGGNPAAGDAFVFSKVTVSTAVQASSLGTVRTNLVANPSFEVNTAGWTGLAPTRAAGGVAGSYCLTSAADGESAAPWLSTTLSVTGGRTYQIRASARGSGPDTTMQVSWGFGAGKSRLVTVAHSAGTWATHETAVTLPDEATVLTLSFSTSYAGGAMTLGVDAVLVEEAALPGGYFDGATAPASGWTYAWAGTAHASRSTAFNSSLAYALPVQWRDVTGPVLTGSIERECWNVGTTNVTIRDLDLDPSRDTLIRPGRRMRVNCKNAVTGAWEPIGGGLLTTARTTYDNKKNAAKRAKIELVAQDNFATLAQHERPDGVGTVTDLAAVLEGCGVPWSINGSGNQVAAPAYVTKSSGTTAVDQVAITRDTRQALAYIDRRGVAVIRDRATLSTVPVATYDEAVWSTAPVSWATTDCINTVNVVLRRTNLATGETVEVNHGPFINQASVDEWGPHSATFTVQGIADTAAAASAFAAAVLEANGTPRRRVETLSHRLRTPAVAFDPSKAGTVFRELGDLVRVIREDLEIDQLLRVQSIALAFTAKTFDVTLGFGDPGSVAVPTVVPPVQPAVVYATRAAGSFTVPAGAGGALEAHNVTFPGPFSSAPIVMVNAVVADPAAYLVTAIAPTAVGFQIKLRRAAGAGASFPVTWIAQIP